MKLLIKKMRAIQQNSKISDNPDIEKYNESNEKKNKSDNKISKITKKNMRNKINVGEISQTYLIKKNKSKTAFHSFQYIIFLITNFSLINTLFSIIISIKISTIVIFHSLRLETKSRNIFACINTFVLI